MFQQFFKDTLIGRFIKRLLRSTNLPLLNFVTDADIITKDCLYIYKNNVIKAIEDSSVAAGNYSILKPYDNSDMQIHYNFHSKFMYYDSETHTHLGNYLRYIKGTTGLDLMPYYNCYNNKSITRAHLSKPLNSTDRHFKLYGNMNYKIHAIPVKFGKEYTIAIDSDGPISVGCLIYNEDCGCIIKDTRAVETAREYYSDYLKDTYKTYPVSHFTQPFVVAIKNAQSYTQASSKSTNSAKTSLLSDINGFQNPAAALYAQENNLYLLIQTSKDNNSSVVAIEGNYVNTWKNCISNMEYMSKLPPKNLALLHFNSHTSYAFSDRLIEYLLLSIITENDEIDDNIGYLQDLLKNAGYSNLGYPGIWNDKLKSALLSSELRLLDKKLIRDLDGYLNKDLEKYLLDKGG